MQSATYDRSCCPQILAEWVRDARQRSMDLVADLDDQQLMGSKLATVNPLIWEIGHAAWFQERWVLQHAARQAPFRSDADRLWDSISIPHEVRWDLPIPSRRDTLHYLETIRDRTLELLDQGDLSPELTYFVKLSVFHEDMHTEAYTQTRQTFGYAAPRFSNQDPSAPLPKDATDSSRTAVIGDAEVEGGPFLLGACPNEPFVFDNEQWAHRVSVEPFAIARTATTQGEFSEFVEDGGYLRRDCWSREGWQWRETKQARHPAFWKREGNAWWRRDFDAWLRLEPNHAVVNVNWHEAEAYCRWAGRRLPTEAEWEFVACGGDENRHYAWGKEPPATEHANLNWQAMGVVDATDHSAGDCRFGCRQLYGNVWEWTASTFEPFAGFEPGPYKEFSRPCFGESKVVRGGCWTTRSRMLRNTLRNFFRPDRTDTFTGFRTCAASY